MGENRHRIQTLKDLATVDAYVQQLQRTIATLEAEVERLWGLAREFAFGEENPDYEPLADRDRTIRALCATIARVEAVVDLFSSSQNVSYEPMVSVGLLRAALKAPGGETS